MGSIKEFGQIAEHAPKNPLGIIGLFLVLVNGIAGLVATSPVLESNQRLIIILFIVGFPILVIWIFYQLVTKHHTKLYAPADFADEANFMKSVGDLKSSIKQIKDEIDKQPLYRYTRLSEDGKQLILALAYKEKIGLHEFSKEKNIPYDKLMKQTQILKDYEWLYVEGNMDSVKISDRGKHDVFTFEDLCYGRMNGLERSKRLKQINE